MTYILSRKIKTLTVLFSVAIAILTLLSGHVQAATTLTNRVALSNLSGATGSQTLYQIAVPSGASNLRFTTTGGGGGDLDIFAKFSLAVSLTAYDAKSTGPTSTETITISAPQVGTYNLLLHGYAAYSSLTLLATYDIATTTATPTPTPTPTSPSSCSLSSSTVTPAIASKAAWDAKFDGRYGTTLPALSGGAETFAWQGHYWLRSYVSMAKTYGDTKYLDRAVKTIDYWFANQETAQGWGASINPAQMFLDTGVIAQAVSIFSYAVWNDSRFIAYRPKADAYLAKIEPILRTYDAQWVDAAPYSGSPGFYLYATCGGVCSPASLVMYNQGAAMAKAWLLIDRTHRLRGQTPDAGYLHKANAAAAYFKTFARPSGSAYVWDYGGARTGTGMEDTSHGHLDMSLLATARKFGIGGLTDADMSSLAATMQKILNGAAGPNDVSTRVDGSGLPTSNWDRVSIGYDWIELADYDPIVFDKTVKVFNTFLSSPSDSRAFLGWAEILRKKACVGL